jgi:hypothetical protein
MRSLSLAVAVTLLASAAVQAQAQSLAEAAAKERERRKGKTSKVLTEEDLKAARLKGHAVTDASETGEAQAEGASAQGEAAQLPEDLERAAQLKAENEKGWQKRVAQASAQVAALQSEVEVLENALADLSQNQYSPTRAQQSSRLEQARAELQRAQQTVGNLEDEGRRNGYSSGN